jgi:hypothetical protein
MPVSLGLTVKLIIPVPVKLVVDVISIHSSSLTACQLQPLPVVIVKLPVPPSMGNNWLVLEIAKEQGAVYVYPPFSVPLCMVVFVTTTSTTPAPCAAVTAVIVVELTTLTDVAAVPPSLTVAPDWKFAPVTVTEVPPPVEPELGEIADTVGDGGGVPDVVNRHTGPLAVWLAIVLPTTRQ